MYVNQHSILTLCQRPKMTRQKGKKKSFATSKTLSGNHKSLGAFLLRKWAQVKLGRAGEKHPDG